MHVFLFDIDGTLLNSGGAGRAALESALSEEFQVILQVRVPYSGRTDRAIVRDLFHHHGIGETRENWERLLAGYLRRLPSCLAAHNGCILPGIDRLLDLLRQRDQVGIGLLTGNVRAGAKAKLGYFGLEKYFSFGGFGDDHLDRDDVAREALGAIRRHLGPAPVPEKIWVIGDTPLDVRCARAIGVRVAAVATGWHSLEELAAAGPDLLLADFSDPAPLLLLME